MVDCAAVRQGAAPGDAGSLEITKTLVEIDRISLAQNRGQGLLKTLDPPSPVANGSLGIQGGRDHCRASASCCC